MEQANTAVEQVTEVHHMGDEPLAWLREYKNTINNIQFVSRGMIVSYKSGLGIYKYLLEQVKKRNRTIHLVGNGGSASLCDHICEDYVKTLRIDARTYTAPGLMSCMANDYGWDDVYARALDVTLRKGDLLIAVSSSGNSQNIVNAAQVALDRGVDVMAITGFAGSDGARRNKTLDVLGGRSELSISIDSRIYGHIEVLTEAILHSAIDDMGGYIDKRSNADAS